VRHFRSILYAVVLAPAVWVLVAVGLTHDLTARGRDGFAVESFTGLLMLLLGGAAYGILIFAPISPLGPTVVGVVFLAAGSWAIASPTGYAGVWPAGVVKDGFDLSRPGYGLAALLSVPMILTVLSVRRWRGYEPLVLPLVGQIGRARGAAPAPGVPVGAMETAVLPPTAERTTLFGLLNGPDERTTLLQRPLSTGYSPNGDSTTVMRLPVDGEATTILRSPRAGSDEPPTVAVVEETSRSEPPTVTLPDERPTEDVRGSDESRTEDVTAAADPEPPTVDVVEEAPDEPPTEAMVAVAEPVADADADADEEDAGEEAVTEPIADAGEEAVAAPEDEAPAAGTESVDAAEEPAGEAAPPAKPDDEPAEEPTGEAEGQTADASRPDDAESSESPEETADEDDPALAYGLAAVPGREPADLEGPTTDLVAIMRAAPVSTGPHLVDVDGVRDDEVVVEETTYLIVADDGGRTQQFGVRPTFEVPGERTVEVRPGGPGEETRVIRPRKVDDTEVIRLGDDGERTQLLGRTAENRPAGGRTPSIAGAESPNFSDDPTGRIQIPQPRPDDEPARTMTVMNVERPPEIPAPRTSDE
jgi:hypothetical protein